MKKCKHNCKPIEFIRCIHNKDMRTLYVYQMQCMECGKKHRFGFYPIFMSFKEMQEVKYPFRKTSR